MDRLGSICVLALALGASPGCYSSSDVFSGFTAIATARNQTCGLRSEGTVACWGQDFESIRIPTETFSSIDGYQDHFCAIDGARVACWGRAGYVPPSVLETGRLPVSATKIVTGKEFDCVLSQAGQAHCFAYDGQPVAGTPTSTTVTLVDIDVGNRHGCGETEDNEIVCWGDLSLEQEPKTTDILQVQASGDYTCTFRGRSIGCWGAYPAGIGEVTNKDGVSVFATGESLVCTVRYGDFECAGTGAPADVQPTPPSSDTAVSKFSIGGNHACVIWEDASVSCWGSNEFGESDPGS